MLTVGSLFAGIGGFDLGLERAGMQVKWQVEIDPYCLKVLEKHWPHVRRYTDIKTVDWSGVEPVDLVCGGFPCQPVSVAGKRKGTADARWLWPEFVRCLRVLRPSYVILENVPGLLTANDGQACAEVLDDLSECGYMFEWQIISAAAVGAPHLRQRVWIVAYTPSISRNQSPILGIHRWSHEAEQAGADVPNSIGAGTGMEKYRSGRQGREHTDAPQPTILRQEHGAVSSERIASDSKDVSDSDEPRSQRRISEVLPERAGERIARTSNPSMADTFEQQRDRWRDWTCGWEREPQEALRDAGRGGRQEAWMSIPEPLLGRVADGIPDRVHRLRSLGNAVVPQVVEWIGRQIIHAD